MNLYNFWRNYLKRLYPVWRRRQCLLQGKGDYWEMQRHFFQNRCSSRFVRSSTVRDMCRFTTRYVNFLISFYQLLEEYPRLCYCAVRIRTFMLNMKIIREICEEEVVFGKTYLRTILYAIILLNDVTQCRQLIYGQQRFPLFYMTSLILYQDS